VFWVLAIVGGFLTLCMLVLMRETYAPVLLQRKATRLRKETGNQKLQSQLDSGLSPRAHFVRALLRPTKMLVQSPLVLTFAVYSAIVYGYLCKQHEMWINVGLANTQNSDLLFSSITEVFTDTYHFSTSIVGLAYLGVGVGTMLGLGIYTRLSDAAVKKAIAAQGDNGTAKPEVRLLLLPVGAILVPAGFFLYGWTAQYRVHWIVPMIGMAIIGVGTFERTCPYMALLMAHHTDIGLGNLLAFMAITMYLIDAFTLYAASALAAVTVVRSIGGALLPLAALKMYAALGLGWGNSLLGFIAVGLVPVPFIFMSYGEYLRERFKINNL
jgi:hypothetical protein